MNENCSLFMGATTLWGKRWLWLFKKWIRASLRFLFLQAMAMDTGKLARGRIVRGSLDDTPIGKFPASRGGFRGIFV